MKNKQTTLSAETCPKKMDVLLEQETSLKITDFEDVDYQPYGVEILYSADETERKGRLRISSAVAMWTVGMVVFCTLGVGLYFVHHYPW